MRRLRAALLDEQLMLLDDPARKISVTVGRRGGKTFAFAVMLAVAMLSRPGANCAFLTLTKDRAKRLMWESTTTGLKYLNQVYGLGFTFRASDQVVFSENGSICTLTGCEKRAEVDKVRGEAFDCLIVDECKSIPDRILRELVYDAVGPAMNDFGGTLVIGGTPGFAHGLFYESTPWPPRARASGRLHGFHTWLGKPVEVDHTVGPWSFHRWDVRQNTKRPGLWERCLEDKVDNGWSDDNPIWLREYLAQWTSDDGGLVYAYNRIAPGWNDWAPEPDPKKCNEHGLPKDHDWCYVLSIDIGYDDDTAFQALAYSDTHPVLHQCEDFSMPEMTIADIERKIVELENIYGVFETVVGDRGGGGKQIFASMAEDYGRHIEPAEKQHKLQFQALLNSDLHEGLIKIRPDSELAMEWPYLYWNEDRSGEAEGQANHASDAFLYGWRWCYHHQARETEEETPVGSDDWYRERIEEDRQRIITRRRRAHEVEDWEGDFEGLDDTVEGLSIYGQDDSGWI